MVRMIHVTDLFREWRICTASKADLEPPRTTTSFTVGELISGTLAASERLWIIGGVKEPLGKEGRLGVEVRPVATMSFREVKVVSDSVSMVQVS